MAGEGAVADLTETSTHLSSLPTAARSIFSTGVTSRAFGAAGSCMSARQREDRAAIPALSTPPAASGTWRSVCLPPSGIIYYEKSGTFGHTIILFDVGKLDQEPPNDNIQVHRGALHA